MLNSRRREKKMQPDEMRKIIDGYIHSYNSFDIDGMLKHMHRDISFQNISGGQVNMSTQGLSELEQAAGQAKAIFKSRCQKITGYQFTADTAVIEIDFEGELANDIPDGPRA
jgi:hypothetical protein